MSVRTALRESQVRSLLCASGVGLLICVAIRLRVREASHPPRALPPHYCDTSRCGEYYLAVCWLVVDCVKLELVKTL